MRSPVSFLFPATFLQSKGAASLAIALSGVIWGLWWLPLRALEGQGLSGNWASVVVYAAAALVMLPLVLRQPRRSPRMLRDLAVLGLLSGLSFSMWNHALIFGDVVRVTLLFYLSPVWATAFGALLLRDRISLLRALSILFGLGGAMLVLEFRGLIPVPRNGAEWMALASGVVFALMAVYVRKAEQISALDKTFASALFSLPCALGFIYLLPGSPAAPTAGVILDALPLVLLACVWLAPVMFLILWGAGRLDPGRVTVLLLFEVLASALSAALLTDEPFGWREALGCLLILGAGLVEGLDQLRGSVTPNRRGRRRGRPRPVLGGSSGTASAQQG